MLHSRTNCQLPILPNAHLPNQNRRAGGRTNTSKNQSQVVSEVMPKFPCENTDLEQSGFKVREATAAPPKAKTTARPPATEAASPCAAAAAAEASQGATLPSGAPLIPITDIRELAKPGCKSKLPRQSHLLSSVRVYTSLNGKMTKSSVCKTICKCN